MSVVNQIGNNAGAKIAGAYASSGVPIDTKEPTPVHEQPAVKLDLSTSTKVSADKPSTQAASSTADAALIDEIRSRIANGTFEVDYQKIASEMLSDALASASRRP